MPSYEQFIHGKFVTDEALGYRVVACSKTLTNNDELLNLVKTRRFWGNQPPPFPTHAVGIFPMGSNLVLVQAASAMDEQRNLVFNGGSEFNQHRYIFIPKTAIAGREGHYFELLRWLWNLPIPTFTEVRSDLPPLEIPILDQPVSFDQSKSSKMQPDLQGARSQLLSAIAAMSQGRRVLLSEGESDVELVNSLEYISLLLPASCRIHLSTAIGTLDVQRCDWAELVLKTDGTPRGEIPENVFWLKRQSQKSAEQTDETLASTAYVDLIQAIAHSADDLSALLLRLNTLSAPVELSELRHPIVLSEIIPALSETQQIAAWKRSLFELDANQWETIIPLLNEPTGLRVAWEELQQLTLASFGQYAPILLSFCRSLPNREWWLKVIDQLTQNFSLAKLLFDYGLIEELAKQIEDPEVAQHCHRFCLAYVCELAKQSFQSAKQFVQRLILTAIFQTESDRFKLWDTLFVGEIPPDELKQVFIQEFVPLLTTCQLEQWKHSQLMAVLKQRLPQIAIVVNAIVQERSIALAHLPKLVMLAGIPLPQADRLYRAFISLTISDKIIRDFVIELLGQIQSTGIAHWYEVFPETRDQLIQYGSKSLVELLDCTNFKATQWLSWVQLAKSLDDQLGEQMRFLDKFAGHDYPTEVIQHWLSLITEVQERNTMITSIAWCKLQRESIRQIVLGFTQASISTAIQLAYCLRDSKRQDWIQADLLHFLAEQLLQQKQKPEDELMILLTNPAVTCTYTSADWRLFTRLCWAFQLDRCSAGRLNLSERDRLELFQDARSIIQSYTKSDQTRSLLLDCETLSLTPGERHQLLSSAKLQAIPIDLVMTALRSQSLSVDDQLDWITKLVQMPNLTPSDKADLKLVSVKPLTELILQARHFPRLKHLRDRAIDKLLYYEVMTNALQSFVMTLTIKEVMLYQQELRSHQLVEESEYLVQSICSALSIPIST